MSEDNHHNILFFESASMRGLYDAMESWQNANHKRFLSTSIQRDGDAFYCIALTNPMEVVIVSAFLFKGARVSEQGELIVYNTAG
jgi:hypothetical protein